jgi:riboflavin kinase/FMN adenylyltransferase
VKLIHDLDRLPEELRHGAVAIGNFDGVHLGHARIVRRMLSRAHEMGGPGVAFTFDPHPVRVLRPEHAPPPLTETDRKAELLSALGVDAVIACPTNPTFLRMEAREFFDDVVRGRLAAKAIVEGPNFFFGRDRLGNVDLLREFCDRAGIALDVVEPVEMDGQVVSSSRIRSLVAAGQVEQVARMLTAPYRIRGTVIHGAARGAALGYPTANLDRVGTLLPGEGIYAGRAEAGGALRPAAISVGGNPTFDEGQLKVEVHVLDFSGDLYDRPLAVDFLARLRAVERFASIEELVAQMDRDIAATRRIAARFPA